MSFFSRHTVILPIFQESGLSLQYLSTLVTPSRALSTDQHSHVCVAAWRAGIIASLEICPHPRDGDLHNHEFPHHLLVVRSVLCIYLQMRLFSESMLSLPLFLHCLHYSPDVLYSKSIFISLPLSAHP